MDYNKCKICVGAVSKHIIDSVIKFANETGNIVGLIPSRRQIDYNGGYVGWTTKQFAEYVRSKTDKVFLERDHSGPEQGYLLDHGFDSLAEDVKYMDIIHIDIWKRYKNFEEGIEQTIKYIDFCLRLNPKIKFEIGTEEAIRKFTPSEISMLIRSIKLYLKSTFHDHVVFAVIQSGTALKEGGNIGIYDSDRLKAMLGVCQYHKVLSKEHNGDWLTITDIKEKFALGLDCINIAPEFAQFETDIILENIDKRDFELFYEVCLRSDRWRKWVGSNFDPEEQQKELVRICGHYVLQDYVVKGIIDEIDNLHNLVYNKVNNKLNAILGN